jgi:hypothetical protein
MTDDVQFPKKNKVWTKVYGVGVLGEHKPINFRLCSYTESDKLFFIFLVVGVVSAEFCNH